MHIEIVESVIFMVLFEIWFGVGIVTCLNPLWRRLNTRVSHCN